MKKNILIIGGTSQFGMTLCQILVKKNFNVFSTSKYLKKIKSLNKNYKKIKFLKLKKFIKKEVQKILKKTKPSIKFYFSGQIFFQK